MTTGEPIRLVAGTRGSSLALRQTTEVVERLHAISPRISVASIIIRTEGDRDRISPLSQIGGKGIFVKDIEAALLDRRVDFAVHSLKDLPSTLPAELILAAVTARADVRDALVTADRRTLAELRPGARIGTGSRRRRAELLALRADIVPVEVRGNVDTRIRRVHDGEVDAVVLAAAGLARLGRLDEAAQIFTPAEMLPAVGQGALAIEARQDAAETLRLLAGLDDADSHRCARAERAFLARLGAGCTTPAAAYATAEGEGLLLRGLVAGDDGVTIKGSQRGPAADPEAIGVALAAALVARGALDLLARSP